MVEIYGGPHTTGGIQTTTRDIWIIYKPKYTRIQGSAKKKSNKDERDISR